MDVKAPPNTTTKRTSPHQFGCMSLGANRPQYHTGVTMEANTNKSARLQETVKSTIRKMRCAFTFISIVVIRVTNIANAVMRTAQVMRSL